MKDHTLFLFVLLILALVGHTGGVLEIFPGGNSSMVFDAPVSDLVRRWFRGEIVANLIRGSVVSIDVLPEDDFQGNMVLLPSISRSIEKVVRAYQSRV